MRIVYIQLQLFKKKENQKLISILNEKKKERDEIFKTELQRAKENYNQFNIKTSEESENNKSESDINKDNQSIESETE